MTAREVVTPAIRDRGQGKSLWILGDHYTFKVSSEESQGTLTVAEVTVFPQNGLPPHIHHRESESLYVLEGAFSVRVGALLYEAHAGAYVHIPKGTLHTFKNIGSRPGRLLVILAPGGFENFLQEIGEPALQDSVPPPAARTGHRKNEGARTEVSSRDPAAAIALFESRVLSG
jgi:quercetin dioxygenase-like cupin family protein